MSIEDGVKGVCGARIGAKIAPPMKTRVTIVATIVVGERRKL
jgi:hypothetical protein